MEDKDKGQSRSSQSNQLNQDRREAGQSNNSRQATSNNVQQDKGGKQGSNRNSKSHDHRSRL